MLWNWLSVPSRRKSRDKHAVTEKKKRSRWKRLWFDVLEDRTAPATWIAQGPSPAQNGQVENVSPNREVSGAMHTVVAHPTSADILYAGSVNGGVWKTTNATAVSPTWTPLTDGFQTLSIGALAFDPTDSTNQTLVAGIGRYSSFGQEGGRLIGLLRTTNGGDSWTEIDGGGVLDGKNISGIAARGDTIVVSVNVGSPSGIFRSTNGGASFTRISVGDGSGSTGLPGGRSYDLASDPTNDAVLYTSIVFPESGGAKGVYKSTDTGATWTKISDGVIDNLIGNGTSNLEISVGGSNNVYIGIVNGGVAAGLFRSGDGGANWTQMDTPTTNENGTLVGLNPSGGKGPGPDAPPEAIAGGQGSIHFSILADPTNANIVYVGGDRQPRTNGDTGGFPNSIGAFDFSGRLFRGDASAAAGSQWVHLTHSNTLGAAGGGTASNSAPHADSRDMTFDANGNLIEVDDGGIYKRTSPRTNAGDWFSIIGNLQVTEAHDVAYDTLSNVVMTGNQDTGTTYQISAGSAVWNSLSTADGGDVAVDAVTLAGSNQSIRYSSFQTLQAFRRTIWNSAGGLVSTAFPALSYSGATLQAQFKTPFVLNAIDPRRIIIGGNNFPFESLDATLNTIELSQLTGTNLGGVNSTSPIAYGGIIDGSPNPDLLYVGSGSRIFTRTSSGTTLTQSGYTGGFVRDITIDTDNGNTAFAVDDNQVFVTLNGGTTWTDITGNLAAVGGWNFFTLEFIAGVAADVLVVGTGSGVYASTSFDFSLWHKYGDGLPNAIVYDLDYDPSDKVLVAGTMGRGAWLVPTGEIVDFGDAPATYGTLAADNGARHIDTGPRLGATRDAEGDAPSASLNGLGDDNTGADDEDGVALLPLLQGGSSSATVTVSGAAGKLDAWIDFNRNGVFDSTERITAAGGTTVAVGTNVISFDVPANASLGTTYARFRLSSAGGLSPIGLADDGEVEDYAVRIGLGRIAFRRNIDGNNEIFVMNVDGSGEVNLTNHPATDTEPAWSPDGTKIVFVSNRDGNNDDLWIMNADGSNPTQLTDDVEADRLPQWSPDGTKVVFERSVGSNREIFVININGTGLTNLTNNAAQDRAPHWSPDGTKIVFQSRRSSNDDIYVMNADGSNVVRLTTDAGVDSDPQWSPDGTRIVFVSGRTGDDDIWIMDANGSNQTNLTSNTNDDTTPAWAPDGSKIVFATNRDGGAHEIYTINPDGSSPTRLTNDAFGDAFPSWGLSSVAPPTTTVTLDAGNVIITDLGDKNDTLVIRRSGANLVVTDPNNSLLAQGGAVQVNPNTVEIPLASITGNIQVLTSAGDDRLTVDFADGNPVPGGGISYQGGANGDAGDELSVIGFTTATLTYNYTSANDGSVVLGGLGTITYTGLEPITSSGTATDLIFNLTSAADQAVIEDDGAADNGILRLRSANGSFELTDFPIPTGSLTINLGGGADTLDINALDGFNGAITGSGDDGSDAVNVNTALALRGNLTLTAETIRLNNAAVATDAGANAGSVILTGAVVLGASVTIDTDHASGADGAITVNGTLNADDAASNRTLTLNAGSAHINLGAIGDAQALATLTATGNDATLGAIGGASAGVAGAVQITAAGAATMSGGNIGGNLDIDAAAITLNTGTLTVGGAADLDAASAVTVNAGLTLGANSHLTIDAATINLANAAADIVTSGSGNATLTAVRNISLVAGSSISTVNGGVTLRANQGTAQSGDFVGIDIDGATIASTGSGNLVLEGRGGDDAGTADHVGVRLRNSAVVQATAAGAVTLDGRGGDGTDGNSGVLVAATVQVSSADGAVLLTGVAGSGSSSLGLGIAGSVASTGAAVTLVADSIDLPSGGAVTASVVEVRPRANGHGIDLGGGDTATALGLTDPELDRIAAGTINIGNSATGTVRVVGAVQHSGDAHLNVVTGRDVGVLSAGALRTVNGDLTFTANAAGTTAGSFSGILVEGFLQTAGAGDLALSGRGGDTGDGNHGVRVAADGLIETTSNAADAGTILVTGRPGAGASAGVVLSAGGEVISTGMASVTVVADSMTFETGAAINVGARTVSLRPLQAATVIALGGVDAAGVLGLSDAEITTITAGTLHVGSTANSGGIQLVGTVDVTDAPAIATLILETGGAITDATAGEQADVAAAALELRAGSLGAAGDGDLDLSVVSLTTNTAAGNGAQFLGEANSLSVTSLNAGAGTITVTGGTFNLSASGVIADASSINVAAGELALAAFNETVAGVTLSGGTISGTTGTLTSGSDYNLQAGVISAALAGNVGTVKSTLGEVTLSGTQANTYSGVTTVNDGVLLLGKTAGVNAIAGNLTIGNAGSNRDEVRLLAADQIADTSAVALNGADFGVNDGFLNLGAFSERIGSLVGDGAVVFGTDGVDATFTVGDATSTTFAGRLVGDDPVAGVPQDRLVKVGTGTLILSGNSTFTGRVEVQAGTLAVNGSLGVSSQTLTVFADATLAGSGTVNRDVVVQDDGFLAPGTSPGIINVNDLTLESSATFSAEVNGATPGTQHDQIVVTGAVVLGNGTATLNLQGGFANNNAEIITLIANDGADAVSGFFATYPEGAIVSFGGFSGVISYTGGDGNDVVLISTETIIFLDGDGNLIITSQGGDIASRLTLQADTANNHYVVSDPDNRLFTFIAGATGNGTNTVTVPFAAVTGAEIHFDAHGGADLFTADYSLGEFTKTIRYDGGAGADHLTVAGYDVVQLTSTYTGPSSGTIQVGAGAPLIHYANLEPLLLDGSADELILDLSQTGVRNGDIVLGDDGGPADPDGTQDAGFSAISGNTFEFTQFANPAVSLTIHLGSAGPEGDVIAVRGVDAEFAPTSGTTIFGGGLGDTFSVEATLAGGLSLSGNAGDDIFALAAGVTLGGGTIDGGADNDTLDYSAYTTPVVVNLGVTGAQLAASLDGGQETPATGSGATGTASLVYHPDTHTFDVTLTVSGLLNVITGLHLHTGIYGEAGGIAVGLDIANFVDEGGGNYSFIQTGLALPPSLEAALLGGATYLNLHTDAFPAGEIRGQVELTALSADITGRATATGGVTSIENAVGGQAADSLVGNHLDNWLRGGAGNDTIFGASGADTLHGDDDGDLIALTVSSGPTAVDGGAGADVVLANGSAAVNSFTISRDGAGVNLAIGEDVATPVIHGIGGVETIVAVGYAGSDTFTMADNLDGVADLANLVLHGGNDSDSFQVAPAPDVAVQVHGNPPGLPTLPGDELTFDLSGVLGPVVTLSSSDSGTLSSDREDVSYTGIERLAAVNGTFDIVVSADASPDEDNVANDSNADTFVLMRNGANLEVHINGGLVTVFDYASVADIFIRGSDDADTLTVDHSGGVVGKMIHFDGNALTEGGVLGSDRLVITGTPAGGLGAEARETYLVGPSQDSGLWVLDPDGSMGAGAAAAPNGDEMIVTFTGLEPVDSDVAVPIFDVVLSGGADYATIRNGGELNGAAALEVVDENNTFETFRFANKSTVRLMGGPGDDAFRAAFDVNAAGLATLELYGHVAPDVAGAAPDDDSSDVVQLYQSVVSTLSIFGQGGSDRINNGDFASNPLPSVAADRDLSHIVGTINIIGGSSAGDDDFVSLHDADRAGPVNATLTAAAFTVGTAAFNISEIEGFLYEGSADADTIDVLSTAAATRYFITGGGGSDTVTLGNQSADMALQASGVYASDGGSLAGLLGEVTISGAFEGTGGGDDVVFADKSATALGGTATISRAVGFAFSRGATAGELTGDVTTVAGFAPAVIRFFHGPTDFAAATTVQNLNLIGSTAEDTLVVDHAGGFVNQVLTFNGTAGLDSLVITGDPAGGLPGSARETYLVGASEDAGRWIIDPDDSMGAGAAGPVSGDEMRVTFAGLAPVDSDTAVARFDAILGGAANEATVTNGGALNGAAALAVVDENNTFESFRFANKQVVRLMGAGGADIFHLDATTSAAGLTRLEVHGHVAGDVQGQPGDDDAGELFNVRATLTGIATDIFAGGGDDTVNVGSLGDSLDNIAGVLSIHAGPGTADAVHVNDHGDGDAHVYTVTATQVLRAAGSVTINYDAVETLELNAGVQADAVNIHGTAAATTTIVNAGDGQDTIRLGSLTGSLDDILGPVIVSGEGHTGASSAVHTVVCGPDSVSVTVADTGDVLIFADSGNLNASTYNLSATTFQRTGMALVTFAAIETVEVQTGSGQDDIRVAGTAAGTSTLIGGAGGGDSLNIASTGADSYLAFTGDDAANIATIQSTGDGSVVVIETLGGADNVTLLGTGAGSGVHIDTGDDADHVAIAGTAAGSATLVQGGAGNDVFLLGNAANSLDDILGSVCLEGNGHFTGTGGNSAAVVCGPFSATIDLDSGDRVEFLDHGDTDSNSYVLTATGLERNGQRIRLDTVESILLRAGGGTDTIQVDALAGGVSASIHTTAGGDAVTITEAAANTLVEVFGDDDANVITVQAASGTGIVVVDAGAGDDIITLESAGADPGRGIQLIGGAGDDTVNIRALGTDSIAVADGGADNDNINVGSTAGSLDGVLGHLCVTGGAGANDVLNVNDQADATNNEYVVTGTEITRTAGPVVVAYSDIDSLFLNTGVGDDIIYVRSTDAATAYTIDAGAGVDQFFVGNLANSLDDILGPVTIDGAGHPDAGATSFFVLCDETSITTTVPFGDYVTFSDFGTLAGAAYTLGDTTFQRSGTALVTYGGIEQLDLATGQGTDQINVTSTPAASWTRIFALAGGDAVDVATTGAGSVLQITADDAVNVVNIQNTGLGSIVMLDAFGGDDVVTVANTGANSGVELRGGAGEDTFHLRGVGPGGALNAAGGSHDDVFHVGVSGGSLDGVLGQICIAGDDGDDQLFVHDDGDADDNHYVLEIGQVDRNGGLVEVHYDSIAALSLFAGQGDDIIDVLSTDAAAVTAVNGGGGDDTVNVGSAANSLDSIAGPLHVAGGGGTLDTLNLNDHGDADANEYTITATEVTRTSGPVSVAYSDIDSLVLSAAAQPDVFHIQATAAGTAYTVNAGDGVDQFLVGNLADSLVDILGPVTLNGQGSSGAGSANFTVNCDATSINVAVNLGDQLIVSDFGSSAGATYTLSATTLQRTGTALVTYIAVEQIDLHAGQGSDQIDVLSTADAAWTRIFTTAGGDGIDVTTTGADSVLEISADDDANSISMRTTGAGSIVLIDALGGDDVITLANTGAVSGAQVHGGTGDNVFHVQGVGLNGAVDVRGGADDDTFHVGAIGGSLDAVLGQICISGGDGHDHLLVHDEGDADDNDYTLTAGLVNRNGGPIEVHYESIEELSLFAGQGADTIDVFDTPADMLTSVNGGAGDDTINVGSAGNSLDSIAGPLHVNGGGGTNDVLNLNDHGDADANEYVITTTTITRLDGPVTVSYADLDALVLSAADQPDVIRIQGTAAGTAYTVSAGDGVDQILVGNLANSLDDILGPVAVNGQGNTGAGTTSATVDCGNTAITATVDLGDQLVFADFGDPAGGTYSLGAASFQRTGTALVTFATIEQIDLYASLGNDQINVSGTTGYTRVFTTAGGDGVNVATTGAGGIVEILGDATANVIVIQNTGAGSILTVDAQAGADAITVTGTGAASGVRLSGGTGSDVFSIQATAAGSALVAAGGADHDTFNVGSPAPSLDGILGQVCILGESGIDTVFIRDTADTDNNLYTVTSATVDRNGGQIEVFYEGIEELQLLAGQGADVINVLSTLQTVSLTTVHGGGGDDVINVGSLANSLDDIRGSLRVQGGAGAANVLNVNDHGDTHANEYIVSAATLLRVAGPVNIGYGDIAQLNLNAAAQPDTIRVRGTNAATSYTLNTGDGVDQVFFGNLAGSLTDILGPVAVHAQDHTGAASTSFSVICGATAVNTPIVLGDRLVFDDSGDPGAALGYTVTLTETTFQRSGTALVSYDGVERLEVLASQGLDAFLGLRTAAATWTRIFTTAGGDDFTIDATGDGSVLEITGDDLANGFIVQTTGIGSIFTVDARGGPDLLFHVNTGPGSGVQFHGGAGADRAQVLATGVGSILVAAGGADNDTFEIGSAANSLDGILGQICVAGDDGADSLLIRDDGDTTANTYLVTSALVNRNGGLDEILYETIESLTLLTGTNDDIVNVPSTLAGCDTIINTGAGNDFITVSSDAPAAQGHLDDIRGRLSINAGSGSANRLVVSDFAGSANPSVAIDAGSIRGLAPVDILYDATGGHFTSSGRDGILIRGSNVGNDVFTIRGTRAGSTTQVQGLGGIDTFYVGSTPTQDNGDLDNIAGELSIIGGDPVAPGNLPRLADPTGTRDFIYVNDRANPSPHNYEVNRLVPSAIVTAASSPRPFAGVFFDPSTEYVRLDGTDRANIFDVLPSPTTQFYIDGNLPPPGECGPEGVDYLRLDTTGTTGRKLHIDSPGAGRWSFTSAHPDVLFESIEKFNHVDRLTVANSRGRPIVRVYDAETMELLFTFRPYQNFFVGGVRVAVADMNCDGIPDIITAPGAGHNPTVRVYNGAPNAGGNVPVRLIRSFNVFATTMKRGVFVAAGDVTGDGINDLVVGADAGFIPQVRVFDGRTVHAGKLRVVKSFNAYPRSFRGGVRVATGDLNGDGVDEIVTGSGPGQSLVRVFAGRNFRRLKSFKPLGAAHNKGLYVAVGDFNGDGINDVIAASDRNWVPIVAVFSGDSVLRGGAPAAYQRFVAFPSSVRTGVRVAVKPAVTQGDDDAHVDLFLGTGPQGGPQSRRLREAIFRGNNLQPSIVDAVFQNGFDGMYVG